MEQIYQHTKCGFVGNKEKFKNDSCPNCSESTKDNLKSIDVKDNIRITTCSRCSAIRPPKPRCDNCGNLNNKGKFTFSIAFLIPIFIGSFILEKSDIWRILGFILIIIGSTIFIMHLRKIIIAYIHPIVCKNCGKILPIDFAKCRICGFIHKKHVALDKWQSIILFLLGVLGIIFDTTSLFGAVGIGCCISSLVVFKNASS